MFEGKPIYSVDNFKCPRCQLDTEDNVALVSGMRAIVWCACGLVLMIEGDYQETVHDFTEE